MPEIPAEAQTDLARVTDVAVSPDGDRVAFCTHEYDPGADDTVDSLWIVPADGSREPHRLTRASDASGPVWSPDGTKLGFVAERETDPDLRVGRDDPPDDGEAANHDAGAEDGEEEAPDGDGDEDGDADELKSQVWAFDMARGGDARQVTDRGEGVDGFDWSPDSEQVVVSARDPTDDEREYLEQRRDDSPIEVE